MGTWIQRLLLAFGLSSGLVLFGCSTRLASKIGSLAAGGTVGTGEVYSGGEIVQTALHTVRGRMIEALDRMSHWNHFADACAARTCGAGGDMMTCELIAGATPAVRNQCEAFLRDAATRIAQYAQTTPPPFELSYTALTVTDAAGVSHEVAGKTPLGPTGPIAISVPAARAYSQAMLLALVMHEFGHKVVYGANYSEDHDLLTVVGAATALYASEQLGIPGGPDASLSDSGFLLYPATAGGVARDLVRQPDGKFVVGGSWNKDYAVMRFNAEGALDTSFGAGKGMVVTDLPLNVTTIYRLGLFPDGRIAATGLGTTGHGSIFTTVRYLSNGAVDASCGADCISNYGYLNQGALGLALAIQPDGKTVVAGQAYAADGQTHTGVVVRYLPNGAGDPAFGVNGVFAVAYGGRQTAFYGMTLQPDGKVILSGWIRTPGFTPNLILARLHANGTLDTTWGGSGLVEIPGLGSPGYTGDMIVQEDGKIVAVAYAHGEKARLSIVRMNGDGTLDTSFGSGGIAMAASTGNDDYGNRVFREPGGKFVAVGTTVDPTGFHSLTLARFNADGTPDNRFSDDGIFNTAGTPLAAYSLLDIYSLGATLLPVGKVAVFATAKVNGSTQVILFRYWL